MKELPKVYDPKATEKKIYDMWMQGGYFKGRIDPDKKPRAATFPHREHQARLDCAECHHGQGADGKQTPYVPGQQIAKCESCHNTKAEGMNKEYNTFQKAAHANCRSCHQQTEPKLAKCSVCHKKDE